MSDRQALTDGIFALGLEPDPARIGKLLAYAEELAKWNRVYNLTAIPAGKRTLSHHLLDSLAVAPFITTDKIIDIGSGGGLPGIPLAVYRPGTHVTLLDSVGKKTRFLEHVRILLNLGNVEVVRCRAEDFTGQYSLAVCRGLGSLADIVRMAAHLLMPGGRILALKGSVEHNDLSGIQAPFRIERIQPLSVPGIEAARCLVVMNRRNESSC